VDRLWSNMLHVQLIVIGYVRCKTDICLSYKSEGESTAIMGIYVDDLLVTASSTHLVDKLFANLESLEVKNLGIVRKFLGIRVQFEDYSYALD
jgi:hypothetical protein